MEENAEGNVQSNRQQQDSIARVEETIILCLFKNVYLIKEELEEGDIKVDVDYRLTSTQVNQDCINPNKCAPDGGSLLAETICATKDLKNESDVDADVHHFIINLMNIIY